MQMHYADNNYNHIEACGPQIPFMPIHPILARAYIPFQFFCKTYNLEEALEKGTLFPELYRSYVYNNEKHMRGVRNE